MLPYWLNFGIVIIIFILLVALVAPAAKARRVSLSGRPLLAVLVMVLTLVSVPSLFKLVMPLPAPVEISTISNGLGNAGARWKFTQEPSPNLCAAATATRTV